MVGALMGASHRNPLAYTVECMDCNLDVARGLDRCPRCNGTMRMLQRFNELLRKTHEAREANGISPTVVPAPVRRGGDDE